MLKQLLIKKKMRKDSRILTIGNKAYAFDFEKIKSLCLTSQKEKGGEVEIMEVQEPDDRGGLFLTSRTVHEVKSTGNPQNDTIMYDLIKLFMLALLNSEINADNGEKQVIAQMDLATRLAFNTLLEMGVLYEIKEK